MKEATGQYINKTFIPDDHSIDELGLEFKDCQPVTVKMYAQGAAKARSVSQLGLFMACCKEVVLNTEDVHWNHIDKVLQQVKVELSFLDMSKTIVDRFGNTHLCYRSINFANLKHMEACNFFDRAFPVLAGKIKVSVDELIAAAQAKMLKR